MFRQSPTISDEELMSVDDNVMENRVVEEVSVPIITVSEPISDENVDNFTTLPIISVADNGSPVNHAGDVAVRSAVQLSIIEAFEEVINEVNTTHNNAAVSTIDETGIDILATVAIQQRPLCVAIRGPRRADDALINIVIDSDQGVCMIVHMYVCV